MLGGEPDWVDVTSAREVRRLHSGGGRGGCFGVAGARWAVGGASSAPIEKPRVSGVFP